VIFFGTAAFAVPSLRSLAEAGEEIRLVVTQPDRPRGRGRRTEPSPVKESAERLGLPFFQPERLATADAIHRLRVLEPEFGVVVAYGQLLRPEILALPTRGVVNLHPSLLPRHRGPSPVAWTILCGDEVAGNSTMVLDEGMDTGPVLLQESFPLDPAATRGEVEAELAPAGAALLVATLAGLRAGQVRPQAQDECRATMSRLLTRELRAIDWRRPAAEVRALVHALAPQPAALVRLGGRLVKVLRVREVVAAGPPGMVLDVTGEGPVVACGDGAVLWLEVQPEGKRPMDGGSFVRGGSVRAGDRVESPWDE
jgi:methionyl-tRNA formyltransferase